MESMTRRRCGFVPTCGHASVEAMESDQTLGRLHVAAMAPEQLYKPSATGERLEGGARSHRTGCAVLPKLLRFGSIIGGGPL
jgi:hypothetical protein